MKTTILNGIDTHRDTLLIVAFLAALIGGAIWSEAGSAAPEPEIVTVIVPPTAVPTRMVKEQEGSGPRLPRASVAYASPGGAVLGALEPGRRYRPVARYGANWVQIDAEGSGLVWIDAGAAGITIDVALVDLSPRPTAEVIAVSVPPAPAGAPPASAGAPAAAPAPTMDIPPGPRTELPPGVDPLAGCCNVNIRLP